MMHAKPNETPAERDERQREAARRTIEAKRARYAERVATQDPNAV